jgi:sodium/potassium-transporting ATPase subunit alpha
VDLQVTGDHPLTAAAIARQVNIFPVGALTRSEVAQVRECALEEVNEDEVDCVVVAGPELDSFTEEDWKRTLLKDNIVFARTTPQQKLFIVEHLQAMGHVVAATGDGVNDSPVRTHGIHI